MWFQERRRVCRHAIATLFLTEVVNNLVTADCAPYPVAARIRNVSLSNGQLARGVELSVGHPSQNFAFLPQWPINNTIVYGLDGYCTDPAPESEAGCTTWRGGQYNLLGSDTRRTPSNNPNPIDGPPYHTITYTDNFKINDNVTLNDYAFGVPLSDTLEQGYHPMMAIGLGPNSTILTALKSGNHIASRVWSMFFGWVGANPNTQLDGTLVFGGYDRAKVSGPAYTQTLAADSRCPTQMLVTINDIVLHFPNGTDASIVAKTSNGSFPACIVPDFPVLMTLATNPYFSLFQEYTKTSISERSSGQQYYSVLYNDGDEPYRGDLSINVRNGPSIRVPNSQLVLPERHISDATGELLANYSRSNLVINPLQDINGHDLSLLGRQFLSSAYVMVNQDKEEFSLWSANPTDIQDLVAIDRAGDEVTEFCAEPTTSPSPPSRTPDPSTSGGQSEGLPTGAIAGIAVGAVAGLVIIVGGLFSWHRRRKASAVAVAAQHAEQGGPAQGMNHQYQCQYQHPQPQPQPYHYLGAQESFKSELRDGWQGAELDDTAAHANRRYELGG